jgi:hypothetical protein
MLKQRIKKREMLTFDHVNKDLQQICNDLLDLASEPGPTQAVARVSPNDPRTQSEYPLTRIVRNIITNIIHEPEKLYFSEDHGNLVIVWGLENPTEDQIKKEVPVALVSHLDEITYLIGNKNGASEHMWKLLPLCNPPRKMIGATGQPFMHKSARILGYRKTTLRELTTIGFGEFKSTFNEDSGEREYWLTTEAENVLPGDVVIQDYGTKQERKIYDLNSRIRIKALDDRVGVVVHLYTLKYLVENKIPVKLILAGDEEGYPEDISWARLIRHTMKKYCHHDNIIIICDGVDGKNLEGFRHERENEYLSEALLLPYTSSGKGGGEHGIFSLMRDYVSSIGQKEGGFESVITTDYVSRSVDPKIMDEFSFITFIDWSNGRVGSEHAVCHLDESILVEQLINVIGLTYCTVDYFNKKFKEK